MPRKVFISVLGTNDYRECVYACEDYKSASVRFIQEATLDYLIKQGKTTVTEWDKEDAAYILLTEDAYQRNWVDNGQMDRDGKQLEREGLCTRLKAMHLPFEVHSEKGLPIGNNETEIWNIFSRVYSLLEEGDELYFDLTHGFRYLPMLVLVLGNYAHYLKNVTIKSITYGNFEGRDKTSGYAPIVNLLSLSLVQDWAFAAGQYVQNGVTTPLMNLCNAELKPILRETKGKNPAATSLRSWLKHLDEFVLNCQTCRGESIIQANEIRQMREQTDLIDQELIPPLVPIFEYVENSLKPFDTKENLDNAFHAAEWCCNNGLYQQAITILKEYIVTVLCEMNGLDRLSREERDLINSAITILRYNIPETEWNGAAAEQSHKVKSLLHCKLFQDQKFMDLFDCISETRNDIDHSGMRKQSSPATTIQSNIKEYLSKYKQLFYHNLYAND